MMFDTEKSKIVFEVLPRKKKLEKIKSILAIFKNKSPIFAKLYEYVKDKDNMEESLLNLFYDLVMSLLGDLQDDLLLFDEKHILKKLKSDI